MIESDVVSGMEPPITDRYRNNPNDRALNSIIGETACDGKKKMFELISHIKPTHIVDLPQLPDEPETLEGWAMMVHKLKIFLEKTFGTKITDDRIESEIRETNQKNRLMNGFSRMQRMSPRRSVGAKCTM